MKKVKKEKMTVGRNEKISLPELGLSGIDAKIDTGAYSSAIHCHDIHVRLVHGIPTLCFKVLDPSHPTYNKKENQFQEFLEKRIKNSSGVFEKRFVIRTLVQIGKYKVKSLISLTDRGRMRYPVLIGRKLLNKRFVVDVSRKNCLEK